MGGLQRDIVVELTVSPNNANSKYCYAMNKMVVIMVQAFAYSELQMSCC